MDTLAALEQAARASPGSAEAQFRLAHALQSGGRLADAIDRYRRVLEIEPDVPGAHNNLGNALRDLGRLEEAIASYHRALELQPDFADAHNNLGTALRRAGRLEDALRSHRRALEIRPDFADAHNNEGNALRDLGRMEEAAASYRRAIEIRAEFAAAHNNLGNVLRDSGRLEEAIASYRRALECKSDLAEAYNNLGNALLDSLRLDEAAACYTRAVQLRPGYARALTALARVLRQQNRPAEAEATCRRALEIEPHSAESLAFLGELHADQGQFADAEALFRRALAIDPKLAAAWCGISRCRKAGPDDGAWLLAVLRLVDHALPIRDEISLRYAIGKHLNDLGDFVQAFAHYRRANDLTRRYGARYDREAFASDVDRVIDVYGASRIERLRAQGSASDRPVLIVGMPRSGTTLAEQILASHPAVFGAGELPFWSEREAAQDAAEREGAAVAGEVGQLAERYLGQLATFSTDALRVVDKMPMNYMNLGLIHTALPRARIIHMRRNPIDNCLSIYFQNFSIAHAYATDLEDLAHFYMQYLRLMEHWRNVLPAEAMLEVPYESLIDEQEAWSRRMVEFIRLPWDRRCLDFDQTRRTVITPSRWRVRQKLDRTAVGRWRNYERFIEPLKHLLATE